MPRPVGPKSAELGQVIKHLADERGWTIRRMANVTGAPERVVQSWIDGQDVPTGSQWNALKRAVNFAFARYAGLYQEARVEQGFSPLDTARSIAAPLTTNMGSKLAAALATQPSTPTPPPAPPTPTPTPTQEETPAVPSTTKNYTFPPNAKSHAARQERMEWARAQLKMRPHMTLSGPDSLKELLKQRFGVALQWEDLNMLREEARAALLKQETTPAPATKPEPKPVPVAAPPQADIAEQLGAAAQLVLDAIPNLASFTLTVNEQGEATVDYKVREVRVVENSGSLTVRKK
jgi:hypothetical protein